MVNNFSKEPNPVEPNNPTEKVTKPDATQNVPERMEIRRRISGIIIKDGKILMVKGKGSNEFWTPGGGIEEGESDEECLRRELKEEIGVELAEFKFFREYSSSSFYNPKIILNVKVYTVTISGTIKPGAEIGGYAWITKKDFNSNKYPILSSIKEQTIPYLINAGIW